MSDCCNHSDHKKPHTHQNGRGGDETSAPSVSAVNAEDFEKVTDGVRTAIRIMQMDCPTEEALIRNKLGAIDSIKSMEFNLIQRVLTVVHTQGSLDEVLAAIRGLGFQPELANAVHASVITSPPIAWLPLAVACVAALVSELAHWMNFPMAVSAAFAVLAVMSCGLNTYKKGWTALRNGTLNINALMSIAVTGALLLGQWAEAAMVMVLFTLAELIEVKSLDRARNAIEGLMTLAPDNVSVQQDDGSWRELKANEVEIDHIVRVKAGERIALDGVIVRGASAINQAPITGESLPIDKKEGDTVFAGTINLSGSFDFRVTAVASNTTLARIIQAVESAQGVKAPTQRFVDQFARIYTPIVFSIAVLVAILPPLLINASWHDWVYKALVLLVIACPCALVISTPVTIVSGLTAAARHGILIKGGVYLEKGRLLKWLALDKTGTITHGKPVQTDFELCANVDEATCLSLVASLTSHSDHPVSQAILKKIEKNKISLKNVDTFEVILGRGIRAVIDNKIYFLGNHRLVEELNRCSPTLESRLDFFERQGKTVVMLMDEQQVLALFAVADTVKEFSRDAVSQLQTLGIKTLMLTGDNPHTAQAIAQVVGIDEVRGNQLPEDKLNEIESISHQGYVGMVGDGINDAPALARADIGFAMGVMGTDTAIETADVALMDDDLRKIATFVKLSQSTYSILVQNISVALGIKAVFLVLTVMGMGTMWMAVFADMGASLLVVLNGLRLLQK